MLIILYILLMHGVGRCTDDQIYETKTVLVGGNVRLTCALKSPGTYFWIKLVSENVPKVLARTYGFKDDRRITAIQEPGLFVLRITKVKLSDAGVYYCVKTPQQQLIFLKGAHLKVEGPGPNTEITTVPPSDPVRPGDSVTLQCSVLSANKTCLEEHNVYWFSARLDKFNASFIYTHGNSGERSEKSLDTQSLQKCVYNFSRNNVSSSDAGTYYCAVTTCEEILSRNGTNLDIAAGNMWDFQRAETVLFLMCATLAITLTFLIPYIWKKSSDCCNNAATPGGQQNQHVRILKKDEDTSVYSAATFTMMKVGRG